MITLKKLWTYEDYYRLNDGKRYEVIEGELIEMAPAPNFRHQRISKYLFSKLDFFITKRGLGLVQYAPLDVKLDNTNTVQPDIIYISKQNYSVIDERGVFGSPDLLVEILSPSNTDHDTKRKYKLYERFGVKEYWIVDPKKREVEVYTLKEDQYELFEKGEKVKSKLLSDFEVEFKELEEDELYN